MCRKIFAFILSAALLLLFCAGCGENAPPPAGSPGPDGGTSAPGEQGEQIQLTEEHKAVYAELLWPLAESGALIGKEPPPEGFIYGDVKELEVVEAVLTPDTLILTAELYGTVWWDPETGEERVDDGYSIDGMVAISPPTDAPHAPYILLGTAVTTLGNTGNSQPEVLSCDWRPLENPGRRVLEARSAAEAEAIAASEKVDLSGYDQRLVNEVYQIVRSKRLIDSKEDITRWDLENITGMTINYQVMGVDYDGTEEALPLVDGELLRLMPNLRAFTTYFPLTDYSVFEGMEQLEELRFSLSGKETAMDFSTLRVGKVKTLSFESFVQDIALDLSHANVETLSLTSWSAGVTEFRGCDGVAKLEVHSTRTDTTLINRDTFPNLKSLQMDFFSDYARFRDFSRLATFGEEVQIDLTLTYQACNSKTVATLDGVRLNSLTLDPKDGPWPLDEPDPALVDRVRADRVEWRS